MTKLGKIYWQTIKTKFNKMKVNSEVYKNVKKNELIKQQQIVR